MAPGSSTHSTSLHQQHRQRRLVEPEAWTEQHPGGTVSSLSISPCGSYVAAASAPREKDFWIWETATGRMVGKCVGHRGWVWHVAFSSQQQRRRQQQQARGTNDEYEPFLSREPPLLVIASASIDRTVKIWEAGFSEFWLAGYKLLWNDSYKENATIIITTQSGSSQMLSSLLSCCVAWSPNNGHHGEQQWLAIGRIGTKSSGKTLSFVDIWENPMDPVVGRDVLHKRLLVLGKEADISGFNHTNDNSNWVYAVQFSMDGSRLAAAVGGGQGFGGDEQHERGKRGLIVVWSTFSWACQHTLQGHLGIVTCLAWSYSSSSCFLDKNNNSTTRENDYLASGSSDGTIRVWCLMGGGEKSAVSRSAGECVVHAVLQGHTSDIQSVQWFPSSSHCISKTSPTTAKDEGWLVSASRDRTVNIWRVTTPQQPQQRKTRERGTGRSSVHACCLHRLRGHSDWVTSVVWHPQGNWLLSASRDGNIKQWYGAPYVVLRDALHRFSQRITMLMTRTAHSTTARVQPQRNGGQTTALEIDVVQASDWLETVDRVSRILTAWLDEKYLM